MRGDPERIGPYLIERKLGAGGMGAVYVARHPRLPRAVALKQILPAAGSAKAHARFWREAEAMARVRHPGVVAIHQLGRAPEGPFIVMDLIEGRPLADLVGTDVAWSHAARLVRDLADAVAAVHAAGILHRDLKPQNVLLRPDGSPVLLDFGLARDVNAETLTRTGEVLGTPAYLAPEQARGDADALGPPTDVHALGAILYEFLTGQPPFAHDSLISTIAAILTSEPEWPAATPATPAELVAILRVCLAKAPDDRYPTAAALRDDLDRLLAGAPTEAGRRLGVARARGRLRAAALGGVGVTLALALAALVGWALKPPPGATSGGDHAPGAAGTATAADAPPAAPSPWRLAPGEPLALESHYLEDDQDQRLQLDMWFAGRVASAAGDALELELVAEHLLLKLASTEAAAAGGLPGLDLALTYDTRVPQPDDHPLAAFAAAQGTVVTLGFDGRTGIVSRLEGVDAGGAAVLARGARNGAGMVSEQQFVALCKRALNDAFIRTIFTTLLTNGGPDGLAPEPGEPARLPWALRPGAPSAPAFTLQTAVDAPVPAAVPPLSLAFRLRPEHRFAVSGLARFEDGVLAEARANQRWLPPEGHAGRARSETTWGMRVRRAAGAGR